MENNEIIQILQEFTWYKYYNDDQYHEAVNIAFNVVETADIQLMSTVNPVEELVDKIPGNKWTVPEIMDAMRAMKKIQKDEQTKSI
jgi:hypothetical protein